MACKKVPLVAIVPRAYYDILAAIGETYLEMLRKSPEDTEQYRTVRQALEDWRKWDEEECFMLKA